MVRGLLDRKTILVLGTGRSGTTWLAGLLARPFRYRLLFEPFMAHQVPGAACIADRYYSPGQIPDEVRDFCGRALRDEIDSDWIRQNCSRRLGMHRWRWWPRVRIVKDIRSNLFIPACRALFGDQVAIVALLRRPASVVESFRRVKFPWASQVDVLLEQADFQRDFGVPLDRLGAYAGSQVGGLAVRWAVENAYLLRHHCELGVHLVHYETLRAEPVAGIRALCAELGLEVPPRLEQEAGKLSPTTHPRSPLRAGGEPPAERPEKLSPQEVALLEEVLEVVEVRYPH